MERLQAQGVHHITLTGADRQTSIDFWEGLLGLPFVFEQPNLDAPDEGHLYFDPGCVHHLAFAVSHATFSQAPARLEARGIAHSGPKDRGFMDSIYFREPLGLLIELACYRFEPPRGCSHADVLIEAHRDRVARGDASIGEIHLANAIEALVRRHRPGLSDGAAPLTAR